MSLFLLIYLISPKTCICSKTGTVDIVNTELSEEVKILKEKFPTLASGKAILCFYSPTCSHCMNTAKTLQSVKGKTGVDLHFVVFMIEGEETEAKIKKFLAETKLKALYTTMEFIDFPTDTDPPAILLVNNGKVVKRFFGNEEHKFQKNQFLKAFSDLK